MKAALINTLTGQVVNTIELEPDAMWQAPEGHFVRFSEEAQIGWYYIDGQFLETLPE